MNGPASLDDFGDGGVQVQLGDEAVGEAKESVGLLFSLQLQLVYGVNISDGVHCQQTSQIKPQKSLNTPQLGKNLDLIIPFLYF